MELNTSVHFRHTVHVFHAIIFPIIKSPFLSNSEDLCALCPVESVSVGPINLRNDLVRRITTTWNLGISQTIFSYIGSSPTICTYLVQQDNLFFQALALRLHNFKSLSLHCFQFRSESQSLGLEAKAILWGINSCTVFPGK